MILEKNDYIPMVRICAVKEKDLLYGDVTLTGPEKIIEWTRQLIQFSDREHVLVIPIDTQSKPVGIEIVAIGNINRVEVDIKNIFKHALLSNAIGVFIVHNHPCGSITPSKDDIWLTEKVIRAGMLLDIEIVDHLIFTDNEYISMRDVTSLWN